MFQNQSSLAGHIGTAPTTEPQRITQVQLSLNQLEEVAKKLRQVTEALGERLVPVMRPATPEGQNGQKNPVESKAPLAEGLDCTISHLAVSGSILSEILNRLEV